MNKNRILYNLRYVDWELLTILMPCIITVIVLVFQLASVINTNEDLRILTTHIEQFEEGEILGVSINHYDYPVGVRDLIYWDHDRDPMTPNQLEKIYTINPTTVAEISSELKHPLENYVVTDLGRIFRSNN